MHDILFLVYKLPEGGHTARSLGPSNSTDADNWEQLQVKASELLLSATTKQTGGQGRIGSIRAGSRAHAFKHFRDSSGKHVRTAGVDVILMDQTQAEAGDIPAIRAGP